jgi:hypothetical protein
MDLLEPVEGTTLVRSVGGLPHRELRQQERGGSTSAGHRASYLAIFLHHTGHALEMAN